LDLPGVAMLPARHASTTRERARTVAERGALGRSRSDDTSGGRPPHARPGLGTVARATGWPAHATARRDRRPIAGRRSSALRGVSVGRLRRSPRLLDGAPSGLARRLPGARVEVLVGALRVPTQLVRVHTYSHLFDVMRILLPPVFVALIVVVFRRLGSVPGIYASLVTAVGVFFAIESVGREFLAVI